eukprot:2846027-Pyramimonas_sp.AAC.1
MFRQKVVNTTLRVLQFAIKARTVKNHDARESPRGFVVLIPTVHSSSDEGGNVVPDTVNAASVRPPAPVVPAN